MLITHFLSIINSYSLYIKVSQFNKLFDHITNNVIYMHIVLIILFQNYTVFNRN